MTPCKFESFMHARVLRVRTPLFAQNTDCVLRDIPQMPEIPICVREFRNSPRAFGRSKCRHYHQVHISLGAGRARPTGPLFKNRDRLQECLFARAFRGNTVNQTDYVAYSNLENFCAMFIAERAFIRIACAFQLPCLTRNELN